ncbi:ATP-dependent Clp protease ATP-binding subunit ClpA, partial [Acinetobacter baumannii]
GTRKDEVQVEEEVEDIEGETSASNAGPLELYTLNLNVEAQKGKTDPLIGREKEIERTAQILCRRRKNNPLLVGDPGV